MLLGTRPRGWFPEFHVLGRETFLVPVEWADGRPRVGPVGECHPAPTTWAPLEQPPVRDDFTAPVLAPYRISPRRRPARSWSLTRRPGRLTLTVTGDSLDRPGHTCVGRLRQHHDRRAAARPEPGAVRAGLSVRLDEAHHYGVEVAGGTAAVLARIGPVRQRVAEHPVPANRPVALAVDIRANAPRWPPDAPVGPRDVRHRGHRGLRLVRLRTRTSCVTP